MIKEASNHLLKTISLKARTPTGQKDLEKDREALFRPFDLWFKHDIISTKNLAKTEDKVRDNKVRFDFQSF